MGWQDASGVLEFGGPATPEIALLQPWKMRLNAPLSIRAMTANGSPSWRRLLAGPPDTTFAGRRAYYYEGDGGNVSVPRAGSVLLVEVGSCGIMITVLDRTRITRAGLEAMVAGATFAGCDTTKAWTPFR